MRKVGWDREIRLAGNIMEELDCEAMYRSLLDEFAYGSDLKSTGRSIYMGGLDQAAVRDKDRAGDARSIPVELDGWIGESRIS